MIEKNQERLNRFQFGDYVSSYESLLQRAEKNTILVCRIKAICLVIYKTSNGVSTPYKIDFFKTSINRTSPCYKYN